MFPHIIRELLPYPITRILRHNGQMPVQTIRVVIVDDHPIVRRGLRSLLDTLDGVDVVGEADSGEAAISATAQQNPDVVLMDLNMPGIGGIEATRRIVARHPETAVLVLTMFDDDETVVTALSAGARGYLLKGADQDEIGRALQAVAAHGVIFSPDIGSRVVGLLSPAQSPRPTMPALTAREHDILALLASGQRTAAIAERLYLSAKTVSNSLTTIFAKLGVTSRAEAIVVARQHGFGEGPHQ